MAYAQGSDVSVERSIAELDNLLTAYAATAFVYARDDNTGVARVMFRIQGRLCRFDIAKPRPADYSRTPTGLSRSASVAATFAAAEERRRWRGLILLTKAMLVAVADGVVTLSEAFLPYTVVPGGQTMAEWAGPQLDEAFERNQLPEIMPAGPLRQAITA